MLGCEYDARLEMPGWDTAGFDDGRWAPATAGASNGAGPKVQAAVAEPPTVHEHLPALKVTESAPRVYLFDLGRT